MRMRVAESVLVLVDLQERLLPAIHEGAAVLEEAIWLTEVAQALGVPILATEHCPHRIGVTAPALREHLAHAGIVAKQHFSAVAEGALLAAPAGDRVQWVVAGTEAHVCVQQTVLDLLAAGREVFVVEEAVGSRKPRDKALALTRMAQNGAEIVSREMVAFEWLARADTSEFRDVLRRFIRLALP
ncbi:MAG: isochorismatase family protein [Zoogloeaceae bacterium]|nr:isochorismatase family protein [Zoogloeaceae bacterium]